MEVDPWITLFAIDIPFALLLAIFRPKGFKLLPPPWPRVEHALATAVPIFAALIFVSPLLVAFRPEFIKPEDWTAQTPRPTLPKPTPAPVLPADPDPIAPPSTDRKPDMETPQVADVQPDLTPKPDVDEPDSKRDPEKPDIAEGPARSDNQDVPVIAVQPDEVPEAVEPQQTPDPASDPDAED